MSWKILSRQCPSCLDRSQFTQTPSLALPSSDWDHTQFGALVPGFGIGRIILGLQSLRYVAVFRVEVRVWKQIMHMHKMLIRFVFIAWNLWREENMVQIKENIRRCMAGMFLVWDGHAVAMMCPGWLGRSVTQQEEKGGFQTPGLASISKSRLKITAANVWVNLFSFKQGFMFFLFFLASF